MPFIKMKQLKGAYASVVVEEMNIKFLTDAEKAKLTEITEKGVTGIRRFAFSTASLSFSTIVARDYRTAIQTVSFPETLPDVPSLVIAKITNDYGIYDITVTSKTATEIQFKIGTPLSNTARAFNIEFTVFI